MARPQAALLLALSILPLAACASPDDGTAEQLAAVEARHREELRAFEAEKRRIASSVVPGETLDFGDLGQVVLRQVELVGWPGNAFVRAEFTWVNTGLRTRNPPLVQLTVWDPETGTGRAETLELVTPFGVEYGSGSTYTAWLDVPTEGVHTKAGWTWTIELVSQDAAG